MSLEITQSLLAMSFLDIFALIVLLVLFACVVAAWVLLGMLPGRIARSRNHPQADAVNVCGWWGVLTMGLLVPIAFIWAYYNPRWREEDGDGSQQGSSEEATP